MEYMQLDNISQVYIHNHWVVKFLTECAGAFINTPQKAI